MSELYLVFNMNKTKIEKKLKRKTNKDLVETIILSKKNSEWLKVAHKLSFPNRKKVVLNLDEIDKEAKDGETIVVPGKVLGVGHINKKIRISAFSFSASAEKKLKESKIEILSIEEEIKKNPDAKKIKVLN